MTLSIGINDSYLFQDKLALEVDTSKIIGDLATNKTSRELSTNSRLFIDSNVLTRIKTPTIRIPHIRINLKPINFDGVKYEPDRKSQLSKLKVFESFTFKSIYARIAAERERVLLELIALYAKIQALFRGLSLLQLATVLISCALYSPQFGGSRNLPVA